MELVDPECYFDIELDNTTNRREEHEIFYHPIARASAIVEYHPRVDRRAVVHAMNNAIFPDNHSKEEQKTLPVKSQRMERMKEERATPLSGSSISLKVILLEDYQQGRSCFKIIRLYSLPFLLVNT